MSQQLGGEKKTGGDAELHRSCFSERGHKKFPVQIKSKGRTEDVQCSREGQLSVIEKEQKT